MPLSSKCMHLLGSVLLAFRELTLEGGDHTATDGCPAGIVWDLLISTSLVFSSAASLVDTIPLHQKWQQSFVPILLISLTCVSFLTVN